MENNERIEKAKEIAQLERVLTRGLGGRTTEDILEEFAMYDEMRRIDAEERLVKNNE